MLLLDELTDMHGISIFIFAGTRADLPPFTPSPYHWLDLRLFQGNAMPYPCTALHEDYFLNSQYENSCLKKEIKYQFQVQTSPRKMKR